MSEAYPEPITIKQVEYLKTLISFPVVGEILDWGMDRFEKGEIQYLTPNIWTTVYASRLIEDALSGVDGREQARIKILSVYGFDFMTWALEKLNKQI